MNKYVLIVAALLLVGCEYERSHTLHGWQNAVDRIAQNCKGKLTIEVDVAYRSYYKVTCEQDGPFEVSLVREE